MYKYKTKFGLCKYLNKNKSCINSNLYRIYIYRQKFLKKWHVEVEIEIQNKIVSNNS